MPDAIEHMTTRTTAPVTAVDDALLIAEAVRGAHRLLHTCISPWGLAASGDRGGYHNLWARDSMITSLGALATEDETLHAAVRQSLCSLAQHQTERGLIPNKIDFTDPPRVNFRAYADGSLWFVLIVARYTRLYKADAAVPELIHAAKQALEFMRYQDHDQSGLVSIDEGASWMDLFPLRGKSTYINCLRYFATTELADTLEQAGEQPAAAALAAEAAHMRAMIREKLWYEPGKDIARLIQDSFSTSAYDSAGYDALGRKLLLPKKRILATDSYFLAYLTLRDFGEWFDTFGNLLAIVSGVATPEESREILAFIERYQLASPTPCKAIYPTQNPGDKDWRYYFRFADLNLPEQYHNGGDWPMIGGFYVLALAHHGQSEAAAATLRSLAAANQHPCTGLFEFPEHRHGQTGEPLGMRDQAWSAGMLLAAAAAVADTQTPRPEASGVSTSTEAAITHEVSLRQSEPAH